MNLKYCSSTLALWIATAAFPALSADLQRLDDLLDSMPANSWTKVSTTTFSSAFPGGSTAVNYPGYSNPAGIVIAWSSFAWDSNRGQLLLFGGGHANYAGNEVYTWSGATGAWQRGSLPSKLTESAIGYIPDNSAPQSSHTYDTNTYLANTDRFLVFGGAAFNTGGQMTALVNGNIVSTGPWLWNPNLADANKVGGTSGSGYDPTTLGGNMWTNTYGQASGSQPQNFINSTAAYKNEGGKDVVYLTADPYQSGWPDLYRYTAPDTSAGIAASWELVGLNGYVSVGYRGAGDIDLQNNLFVRTGHSQFDTDLIVWNLNGASSSNIKISTPVHLFFADGTPWTVNASYGLDYNNADGLFYLWDGSEGGGGDVFTVAPQVDANGNPLSNWTITRITSATAAHPVGGFATGVLGKWTYLPELNAFLALDEYRSGDAGVWMYKPNLLADVPEPSTVLMWLAGGGLLLAYGGRRAIAPLRRSSRQ